MSSGDADLVKKPESWPYVPGGDVCGTVVEVDPKLTGEEARFKPGDEVIGTWDAFGVGGLAEYTLVEAQYVAPKPEGISYEEGAAIADSPVNAMLALEDAQMKEGDRILVIGGSGSVGGSIIQIARIKGASFIAATSTAPDLVKSLGADMVIDYREKNWWEVPEFKEKPFDIILDCAEGRTAWQHAQSSKVLKSGRKGGRFIAVVPQEWRIVMHSWWAMMKWFIPVVGRTWKTRLYPFAPRYTMLFPAPRGDSSKRFLDFFAEGKFKVVMDSASPHPLTTQGVKDAFNLIISRRAKGKVVISIGN